MIARSTHTAGLSPSEEGLGARWTARLVVLALGAVVSFAYPEAGMWWLGWVGLAPILVVISRSPGRGEALKRSWFAGVGYLTALHHWVIPYTGIFTVVLAAFVGLFWLPLGLACWWELGRRAHRSRRLAALVVVPSVWVLTEAVRSWEYLGGTWGLLGSSQWQTSLILQGAALGGVWLLSFVMVAVNVALANAVMPGRATGERYRFAVVAVAVPMLLIAYGALRSDVPSTGSLSIGGVQPGVFDDRAARLDAHFQQTRTFEGSDHIDFVVWGQTSVAYDPSIDESVGERLRSMAARLGADLFVNVDARTGDGIVKTTVQYTADGPVSTYGKRRLVPFGEYIPLRPLLGWVSEYTQAANQDRARGQGPVTMTASGVVIGPLVSYESTFPDLRRELARLDVDMTLVQGGTQTFQGTWAQAQQASFEAINAVASGRPALLVAVSGVSAAFDTRGEQLLWYPADRVGSFMVDVPLGSEDTLYVRFGDWVVWLSAAVVVGTLVAAGAQRFIKRS